MMQKRSTKWVPGRDDIINALTVPPARRARAFIHGGASYHDVLALASRIIEVCSDSARGDGPLCLASTDKKFLMAAVAASLSGGPNFVIPHALSEPVLSDACRISGAAGVLSGRPVRTPKGVPNIVPFGPHGPHGKKGGAAPLGGMSRDIHEPFVWLYTGGSTGKPKLWPKSPLNLMGEALNLKKTFAVRPDDIILSTVSPLHIYGLLFSVLMPFVSRARVVADVPYFPREIIRSIRRTHSTIFVGSPVHYKALVGAEIGTGKLRRAFSSGGFLEESHSLGFLQSTGVGVTEVYGSTETGGIAIRCRADGQDAWQPFALARWKVRDERLCVSSPLLSPNLPRDSGGFYTTGDMAQGIDDGTFVLQGRADGIVKIAGKRVDLAEVEQKIKDLSIIDDAFVFSLPSKSGRGQEVAALLVTRADNVLVRRMLSGRLDPLCIPRHFARVRSIPITPAGKPDREKAKQLLTRTVSPSSRP